MRRLPMVIDVHAHAVSEELLRSWARQGTLGVGLGDDGEVLVRGLKAEQAPDGETAEGGAFLLNPSMYRHQERFDRLAEIDVDLQLVCPWTNFTAWPGGAADAEIARVLNRSTAECVAGSGGRFAGLATLALGEPDRAVEELSRALEEHGFVGAICGTYAGDRPLDHPSLEPLFAELERRGLPVLVHPSIAEPTPRWEQYTLNTALEWPGETGLAVGRLIFAGTLERHPELRLVLAHGGGTLPFLRGRLDLAYEAPRYEHNPECSANISKPPSEYLQQLYFDTAVGTPESLHFLIDLVGAERVIFGTDDPFEIADTGGRMALPALRDREPAEREAILGGTLARLIGR
jgi:aminocarboxymuconate-semialdehyde decarboxylase